MGLISLDNLCSKLYIKSVGVVLVTGKITHSFTVMHFEADICGIYGIELLGL